jgi:uncharacterized protein YrrD
MTQDLMFDEDMGDMDGYDITHLYAKEPTE